MLGDAGIESAPRVSNVNHSFPFELPVALFAVDTPTITVQFPRICKDIPTVRTRQVVLKNCVIRHVALAFDSSFTQRLALLVPFARVPVDGEIVQT